MHVLMRCKRFYPLFLCSVLLVFAGKGFASPITFTASLSASAEVPPTGSPATGFATVTVDGDLLSVSLSYTGMLASPSAAHIHCCAVPGVNAPVVLPFSNFPITTSGTYSATFDLTTALTGITESAFLTGLESGLAYTNIHDSLFPTGEIRGLLVQTPTTVPEPGSLLLLSTGTLGLAALLRLYSDRQRRVTEASAESGDKQEG